MDLIRTSMRWVQDGLNLWSPRTRRNATWGLWLLLYLGLFGGSIASSVQSLWTGPLSRPSTVSTNHQMLSGVYSDTKLIVGAFALAPLCILMSGLPRRSFGLRRTSSAVAGGTIGAALIYFAIMGLAGNIWSWVLDVIGITGRSYPGPTSHAGTDLILSIGNSSTAGPEEELFVLAIPFALAAAAKWPRWKTFALVLVVRVAFHLYYGWTVGFVFLWIPAAFILYSAGRSIWPLIIAHSTFDISLDVINHQHGRAATLGTGIWYAVIFSGVALAAISVDRWRRAERTTAANVHDAEPPAGRLPPAPLVPS